VSRITRSEGWPISRSGVRQTPIVSLVRGAIERHEAERPARVRRVDFTFGEDWTGDPAGREAPFVELQDARHAADYDLSANFARFTVLQKL